MLCKVLDKLLEFDNSKRLTPRQIIDRVPKYEEFKVIIEK